MPINSFLYPGAKVVPPFTVANSIRLNQGDDPDMKKTIGAPTSARKFSVSCWVKLSNLGVQRSLWGLGATSGATGLSVRFQDDDTLDFFDYNGSGNNFGYSTNQVFRDVSAWSHFLFAVDTEQSTAHNRVRIYHNGTEIEKTNLTDNPGDPSEDADLTIADGHTFKVGDDNAGANEWAGYIAEFVYIDGLQLTPSSFGEFDTDTPTVWKPKDPSGLTFGNNGFYLDFEDSSNLGNDANGGTDLTETNIAATDQSTDTCSNNYATFNSLLHTNATLSEGNLQAQSPASGGNGGISTFGASKGKWYAEFKQVAESTANEGALGVIDTSFLHTSNVVLSSYIEYNAGTYGLRDNLTNGSAFYTDSGGSVASTSNFHGGWTTNDIIGIALDIDNNRVYFSKNGQWSDGSGNWDESNPTGYLTIQSTHGEGTYMFAVGDSSSANNVTWAANFGSPPYSISSGNSDANGYGNFEYTVPSGYYALNTKNLAEFG